MLQLVVCTIYVTLLTRSVIKIKLLWKVFKITHLVVFCLLSVIDWFTTNDCNNN